MAKQFRWLRRGCKRILGALCLKRAPRPSEEDPEKPVYFQNALYTSKLSIDSPPVDDGPTYPRHFPLLQLPVELQLEVIDCLYDISNAASDPVERKLLLNLRLYVFNLNSLTALDGLTLD